MPTLVLIRHGRTTANATGVLAGRTAGVRLDEVGASQAANAGLRLARVPLRALVASPLERTRQTAKAILAAQNVVEQKANKHRPTELEVATDKGLIELDYGSWTNRPLKELAKEPLWGTVQSQPSAVVFPDGEAMAAMAARAVSAVRRIDAAVGRAHGSEAVWAAVSHGDVIKAVLADALGVHLDAFQRIVADPASISVIRYTETRPYVVMTNTHSGDLAHLAVPGKAKRARSKRQDAVVGGGAGPEPASSPG